MYVQRVTRSAGRLPELRRRIYRYSETSEGSVGADMLTLLAVLVVFAGIVRFAV